MFYLILNDILWRSWSFFLTVALFFLVLCLANSSFLVFLNSQFYLYNPLNLLDTTGLLPVLLPMYFIKAVSQCKHRAHLVCFFSLRDYCPLLSHAYCLKNCFMYLFIASDLREIFSLLLYLVQMFSVWCFDIFCCYI